MPFDVRETTLPGAGKKYEVFLDAERSIAVLIESNGERILYYRETPAEDYEEVIQLSDSQARTLGLFLVGAYYQPVAGQLPEETEAGEYIEWYSVTHESFIGGTSLEDLDIEATTGGTLLGIEHEGAVLSAPPSDLVFEVGDRLIFVGTSDSHEKMESLLES